MKETLNKAPEDTRGRILKAAFEEFYRNGFQGGSLNHIVDAAGTTKGALFHYFAGKNDLGYAVVEEVIRPHMKARWLDTLASSIDPIADLKRAVRSFADEEFRKRIERVYTDWRDGLEAAFTRGMKSGKVRKDISPRNVAALVVAVLEGMIGTAKNAQSAEPLKEAGAAFFEYL